MLGETVSNFVAFLMLHFVVGFLLTVCRHEVATLMYRIGMLKFVPATEGPQFLNVLWVRLRMSLLEH